MSERADDLLLRHRTTTSGKAPPSARPSQGQRRGERLSIKAGGERRHLWARRCAAPQGAEQGEGPGDSSGSGTLGRGVTFPAGRARALPERCESGTRFRWKCWQRRKKAAAAAAMALPGAPAPASAPSAVPAPPPPPTVLMTVRAGLAQASRLLSLPAAAALRLQLSVEPEAGGQRRFRLGLRHPEAAGGAVRKGGPRGRARAAAEGGDQCPPPHPVPSAGEPALGPALIAEYDLWDISYRVRGPTSHELSIPGSSDSPLGFTFPEEREAQRWWTIVSSSLWEVQKASDSALPAPAPSLPAAARGASGDQDPEAALTLELSQTEDLALQLARAIELGAEKEASRCAVALARQQATLSILLKESNYPPEEISMNVGVEDATSSASITIMVHPHTTIAALKQQVFQDYGFHPLVQRWIIGQCLCVDERTVGSYGVRRDGDAAFLYLLAAEVAELSRWRYEEDLAQLSTASLPPDGPGAGRRYSTLPGAAAHKGTWPVVSVLQLLPGVLQGATKAGWSCPKCTFINKPTRPGCEMCSSARPDDYVVPGGYTPDETELWRMQQEQEGIRQYQQQKQERSQGNFQQLLQLEEEVLVTNREVLECLICFQQVPPGQGVLLRECLHNFCRECLRQVINYSEEPLVACPFRDDSYACSSHLQEREIRALVSPAEYRRFLERGLALAERRSPNSFHCRSPDCRGWCIYEDSVNEFRCPICQALNCLLCKAIHEGRNCRQYQDDLQARAQNDAAARQTSDMLQTLVQLGEAMHCPTCLIIVQKKDGCDWIRCTVCQTEICWVTKGPRWGPGGPGDTSGGCRCNINGQRCHPQCQNCH
ncbi:sharpin [Indicator indicator]|uniref:sharpin n=1 Tax=Indicator indicator TaxID=1002788 RepID=UPI0023DFE15B|nr:sharpin [Indicator indicator]